MRYSLQRLALVVLIGAIARPVAAQNTLTLEGSVRYDNAPVNNAQVSVLNIETQESARAATRPTGEFRVLGLFPGRYTVTVRAVGYKPASDTVQLIIGQRARLEFNMQRGATELEGQMVTGFMARSSCEEGLAGRGAGVQDPRPLGVVRSG